MRIIISFLFSLIVLSSFGQITFSTTQHHFGELTPYSARYIDVTLTNQGSKGGWILRVEKPEEVAFIQNKAMILSGENCVLRFNVSPKKKGRFSYVVNVFTSDKNEATEIKLTGSIAEIQENQSNGLTDCPSFGDRPAGKNPNAFNLTVVTIDKITREPLESSKVTFIQNGRSVWEQTTNRKGMIKKEVVLGLSYFYASHKEYLPAELGAYINFKRNYIVLELEKEEKIIEEIEEEVVEVTDEPQEEVVENEEVVIEIEIDEETPPQETLEEIAEENSEAPTFEELPKDNFDNQYFQPINVVFVLDVSMSMRSADKMELLKYSLNELTNMIRPQDKIGIVTYSSNAQTLLKSTSGGEKEIINSKVEKLKAGGYTAGGKGIKMGYKQAYASKIEGVNQVIVITDGAFNRDSKDYQKSIKKYKNKGINLSVVGIKNKVNDKIKMEEAAKIGGGNYISIMGLQDAKNNLRQEIRRMTFLGK